MRELDPQVAMAKLGELATQQYELAKQQPPTPSGFWYRRAKKSVAKGDELYERDEALAAVGTSN